MYLKLVDYVRAKQISRDNVSLGYETIGDFLGVDKKQAYRKMQECLKVGMVELISKGEFATGGIAPSKTHSNCYKVVSAEEFVKGVETKLGRNIVVDES